MMGLMLNLSVTAYSRDSMIRLHLLSDMGYHSSGIDLVYEYL